MADRTLNLGTLFTGAVDATFTRAVESVEGLVARLEGAVAKANAAAAGMAKGVAGVGPAITPLQKYIGDLQKTLAHSPVAMNKAADAATKLAKKYGDSAISIKAWRGSLDGVIRTVESVRQRMIAAGKAGDAYANSINYRTMAEGVLAGRIKATTYGFMNLAAQSKKASVAQKGAADEVTELVKAYGHADAPMTEYLNAQGNAVTQSAAFRGSLAKNADYLGKEGMALRVSEGLAKKFEKAIMTTALRLQDSGVNARIFAESINRSALQEAFFNRQLSITEKGLVFRNKETARGVGLNENFAAKMGLIVPSVRMANAQFATYNKLMGDIGSRGDNFRRAVVALGQSFGTSNYQVKGWGTSLRKTADSIELIRQRMILAGKNGNAFAASVNVATLASRVHNNQLVASTKGFRQVSIYSEKAAQDISKIPPAMKGGTVAYEAMKRGISQVSVVVGQASAETIRYKSALFQLTQQHAPATVGFQVMTSTLNKVERGIQATAARMRIAGKDGDQFARTANRMAMMNNLLVGNLKATSTGFVSVKNAVVDVKTPLSAYAQLIGKVSSESIRYKAALFEVARQHGVGTIAFNTAAKTLRQVEASIQNTAQAMRIAGKDGDRFAATANRMALVNQVVTGTLKTTSLGFKQVSMAVAPALTAIEQGAKKSSSSISAFAAMQGKAEGRTAAFRGHLYDLTKGFTQYDDHVERAAKVAFKLDDALIKTGMHLRSAGVNSELFQANINRAALTSEYLAGRVKTTATGLQFYSAESENAARQTAAAVGVSGSFAKNMGMIAPATKNAHAHLTNYRNIITELVPQGRQYADSIRLLGTTYGRSNKAVETWGRALSEASKGVETKRQALNAAGKAGDVYAQKVNLVGMAEMIMAGRLRRTETGFVAIKGAATGAATGLGRFGAQSSLVGKQIGRVEGGINRLMSAMSVVANYAIAAQGMFLIVNAVKETIMSVARFDQVLKDLQAVTGDTDAAIRVIGNTIKETSDKFVYNADQMSEAARNLAQAGFSAEETLEALPSVAVLATTTMEGMRIAADLLTTTIRAFELNTMESARVADVFAVAANKSKLTIDGLRIVMNYLGPVAHEAGMSLESTAAATMVLADSGIRMSTIGTGLRQVLARMIAPTSAMRAEFEKSGVDISKLNPLTNDFIDVLRELSLGVKDAGAAFRLFGLRGASVAIALINSFRSGSFAEAIDNVYKVGTASVMAAKQMEGIEARAKNLAAKFKLLMISLGEGGLKSAMSLVVDVLRTAVTAMNEFINTTTGRMIVGVAAWTLTIWGLSKALTTLIQVIRHLAVSLLGVDFLILKVQMAEAVGIIAKFRLILSFLWATILKHPFLVLAAAIGSFLVISQTLRDSINKSVEAWEDNLKSIDSNIAKLEFFQSKLAELGATVGESAEGSLAYKAALQRLAIEFPALANNVDLASMSWENLNDVLNEALASEKLRRLQTLATLTLQYARQAEAADAPTTGFGTALFGTLNALKGMAIWAVHGTAAFTSFAASISIAERAAENMRNLGLSSEVAEKAFVGLRKSLAAYVPQLEKAGITSESTVEDITKALYSLGLANDLTAADTLQLAETIKKHWTAAQGYVKRITDSSAELSTEVPKNYSDMYSKLDSLRQVELINASIALDKELDAFRKNADAIGLTEKQKWAVIEVIRHKHLTKFIEDANKEIVTTQQMALLKEAIYAQEVAQIEADYNKRADIISNTYFRELKAAGESAEKKANAEIKYNDAVVAANEEKTARTEALNKEHNDFMIKLYEGYIQRYQERTDLLLNLHQELYKAKQEIAEEHYKWDLASLDRNLAKRKAAIEAMAIPENKRTELLKRAEEDYWNASIRLAQKSARERIGLLEEEVSREKQIINDRYGDAIKLERDRIKAIEDATGKRLQNADREVAAEREKDQKILATEIKLRDQKLKIYGETLAAFEKYIDDQIREQERLASELKRINGEIKDSEREKMEDIRDIKRMEMNDAQKLQDTKAAFEREMQAGKAALATGDTDEALAAAKRAISLSKEKARETKSLNDEIKRAQKEYADAVEKVSKAEERSTGKSKQSYKDRSEAIQDARSDADKAQATLLALGGTIGNEASLINDTTTAWDLYRAALEKVKQDTESGMASTSDNISKTEARVKALKTEMEAITQQKIELETGLLPAQIAAVEASIADLKTRLEGIKAQVNLEVIFPENLTQEISDTVDGSIRDMLGGKESKEIPITPKVDMSSAQGAVDTFTGNLAGLEPKLTVDITATGSTEAPIIDKLQEIENKIWELQSIITSGASKMTFDISTPEGRGATEVINEVLTSLQNLAASLGTINLTETVTGADEVIAQLEQITKLVSDLIALDATVNLNVPMGEYVREMLYDILQTLKMTVSQIWTVAIHVKGLDDLISAKKYIDSLRDKTVYVNVVTRNTGGSSSGRTTGTTTSRDPDIVEGSPDKLDWWASRGGQAPISSAMTQLLSGFGGGDKIKALLEPGEFIIRKEAVQKYGSKLFTALNAMRLATGGYTFDFLKTAKKAGSEATSIKAGLPSVVGAETLQKIRSRIQEYVGATLGRFAKSPQAFTQSVFNAVKNVMRGQYAEINLSTEPARVSSMSGYDTGDTLRRAMGGIVAAVGKIPSHVSAQRLSTGGMAMPKKSRTEESLVVRFQIGDQEYPVAVQDMGSRSMIKQFSRELSKARLTSAR